MSTYTPITCYHMQVNEIIKFNFFVDFTIYSKSFTTTTWLEAQTAISSEQINKHLDFFCQIYAIYFESCLMTLKKYGYSFTKKIRSIIIVQNIH